MDKRPVIIAKDLTFSYTQKGKNVLKNINLEIFEGDFTVIAGPNGSGKTTLVKHFNGLLLPTSGEIIVEGITLTKKNQKKIQQLVGLVFQNPDDQLFFPIVEQDVAFGPRNVGLSKEEIEKKVTHALEEAGVEHLRKRPIFNLSFGEKKKVAFAGILALDPKVVILDEPTLGIDPWAKPNMIRTIKNFRPHHTVVVVTHDFDVMKAADRIILLWEGEVVGIFDSFEEFLNSKYVTSLKEDLFFENS